MLPAIRRALLVALLPCASLLAQVPASPIARIAITPSVRTIMPGDTLRISAQALDAQGNAVSNAIVRFVPAGGYFEGTVDSTGLVTAGAIGTLPVSVIALVPGTRPVVERVEVRMVPGPATRLEVTPQPQVLLVGQRVRLGARAFSAAGDLRREDAIEWHSSAPEVAEVDGGTVTARAPGRATITASSGSARREIALRVVAADVGAVRVTPATSRARQGDVIRFTATVTDRAGRAIPGLTPTWSMAPGEGAVDEEGAFVGYEPGSYTVTASFGERTGSAAVTIVPRDVQRRASVVGRLPMREGVVASEIWIHPNGRNAYLGTVLGSDRWYALDISDPAKPVITDSVMGSMRSVNDLMATADGKVLVYTREGAADRRNGIGIVSLEDPAHPKPLSEFTDGVTAGVHSAFVYTQQAGTHVYLTNDGTGALHVIDIGDPAHPREVARWKTPRSDAGRMLHDVDVRDGLAYLSYWNDGLVILDVGNGVKGGSPGNPQLVQQIKYDLDELYREVAADGGAGFVRGTHTSWRSGRYVFVADEVFSNPALNRLMSGQAARAYGRLHVFDIQQVERPKLVAWYEPENGGVHNIWVEGDTLYLGAYNGGFHAFDVSGELRGDLKAQGREMAHVHTGDRDARIPNAPMAWGAVVHNGLVFVPDMNSGLWIVRLEPRQGLVP